MFSFEKGKKPEDKNKKNAQDAAKRAMEKRKDESKKKWEAVAVSRKLAKEKTEQERKERAYNVKKQMLESTQTRLKAKQSEKRKLEGELAALASAQGADTERRIAELKGAIVEAESAIQGIASESMREKQIVRKLGATVDLKGYEEDY